MWDIAMSIFWHNTAFLPLNLTSRHNKSAPIRKVQSERFNDYLLNFLCLPISFLTEFFIVIQRRIFGRGGGVGAKFSLSQLFQSGEVCHEFLSANLAEIYFEQCIVTHRACGNNCTLAENAVLNGVARSE